MGLTIEQMEQKILSLPWLQQSKGKQVKKWGYHDGDVIVMMMFINDLQMFNTRHIKTLMWRARYYNSA